MSAYDALSTLLNNAMPAAAIDRSECAIGDDAREVFAVVYNVLSAARIDNVGPEPPNSSSSSTMLEHYAAHVEFCPPRVIDALRESYMRLYRQLVAYGRLLERLHDRNPVALQRTASQWFALCNLLFIQARHVECAPYGMLVIFFI